MFRLERSGEEDDAPCVLGNSLESRSKSGRRYHPYQEDDIDALKTRFQGIRECEITAHHLNLLWQTRRLWVSRVRADLRTTPQQLRDNLSADVAGSSNDENATHASRSLCREVELRLPLDGRGGRGAKRLGLSAFGL